MGTVVPNTFYLMALLLLLFFLTLCILSLIFKFFIAEIKSYQQFTYSLDQNKKPMKPSTILMKIEKYNYLRKTRGQHPMPQKVAPLKLGLIKIIAKLIKKKEIILTK